MAFAHRLREPNNAIATEICNSCFKLRFCFMKMMDKIQIIYHLQFPHVAPEKLVCEQSHTYLFHPSVHAPPCIQGRSWQNPTILWQEDRIEPKQSKKSIKITLE